jgi:hypothetical protein
MCKQKNSNPKDEIKTSLVVDRAWAKIVRTMKIANSSNFAHVKLVKVLKRCGVDCIVAKNFWNINSWVHMMGLPYPLHNLMQCEKIMQVTSNHHAMEINHVLFVHIFKYFLIV